MPPPPLYPVDLFASVPVPTMPMKPPLIVTADAVLPSFFAKIPPPSCAVFPVTAQSVILSVLPFTSMPPPQPSSSDPSGLPPFSVRFVSVSVFPPSTLKMRCFGLSSVSLFASSTAEAAPSAFFIVRFLSMTISPELPGAFVAFISPSMVMVLPSPVSRTKSCSFFHGLGSVFFMIKASFFSIPSFFIVHIPSVEPAGCVTVNLVWF